MPENRLPLVGIVMGSDSDWPKIKAVAAALDSFGVAYESEVMSAIRERDRIDSTRADGPLIRPEAAVTIDTSSRSVDEVVDCLESISRERLPRAGFKA